MNFLNHARRAIVHISTVLYSLAENIKLRLQLRYVLFQQSILLFRQRNLLSRSLKLSLKQRVIALECGSGEMLSNPSMINLKMFIVQSLSNHHGAAKSLK